jgi:hypothetical protein
VDRTTASLRRDHFLSKRTDAYLITMHDRIRTQSGGNGLDAGYDTASEKVSSAARVQIFSIVAGKP